MSNQVQAKKLVALVVLIIFAILVWHKRIAFNKNTTGNINENNPFIEIKEVPLKLENIDIPALKKGEDLKLKEKKKWGRNPFELKK